MTKTKKRITEVIMKHESALEIVDWHKKTFPDAGLEGQKKKFKEEKQEWARSHDIMELADIYIVACGLLRYSTMDAMMVFHYVEEECLLNSIYHADLIKAVDKKMNINYHRIWKVTNNGSYHHI